jgi:hypothetical protein
MNVTGVRQDAEHIQEPDNHGDDDHRVQNRFDGPCHRNVLIDKPEDYPNHD